MTGRVVVEADGGSRGNPGPAGYGALVKDSASGTVLAERAASLGVATNNVAEYSGLVAGLQAAVELAAAGVDVRMDSKLVVEQMSGRWKIKHPDLKPLALHAQRLIRELGDVTFTWIPRERNKHADRLANEAMDAAAAGRTWSAESSGSAVAGAADLAAGGSVDSAVAATPRAAASTAGQWAPAGAAAVDDATTTLLLRHGQTAHSVDRRYSGRNDLPLTDEGLRQARSAGARLAGTADAVVSSPLPRAWQTAQEVARVLGVEPERDEDLIETDFGVWEGKTFAEVRRGWAEEMSAWMASTDVAPPGGESFAEVGRRVGRSLDRIRTAYAGRTVVLVSHVTPIKLLLADALGAGSSVLYRIHLDLAGLSRVDWFADGRASVRLVNDTSHLGQPSPSAR